MVRLQGLTVRLLRVLGEKFLHSDWSLFVFEIDALKMQRHRDVVAAEVVHWHRYVFSWVSNVGVRPITSLFFSLSCEILLFFRIFFLNPELAFSAFERHPDREFGPVHSLVRGFELRLVQNPPALNQLIFSDFILFLG